MLEPSKIPLRDIHLPAPIGWWPPAPGWWVLAGLAALALLGAGVAAWWWRRTHVRRLARRQLAVIVTGFRAHRDTHQLACELSMLCRQIALALTGTAGTAAVTGDAWLARLDTLAPGNFFSSGAGQVLAVAPYNPALQFDAETLLTGVTAWLARLAPRPVSAHDDA
jgi:hypothetical protein